MKHQTLKKEWYDVIIENSFVAIMVIAPDRTVYFVNQHLCDITGYSADEILGEDTRKFHYDEESYRRFGELVAKIIQENQPIDLVYKFKPKQDGALLWAHISGERTKDGYIVYSIIDVTSQKELENELQQKHQMLEESQRIGKIGSWWYDLRKNQLTWSKQTYKMFEIEEGLPLTLEDFIEKIHPDDRKTVEEEYEKSLKEHKPYSVKHRMITKNGSIRYLHERCETEYDSEGKPVLSKGTVQDITELHYMYEKLSYLAGHDTLTGLPNKSLFMDRLQRSIKKSKRSRRSFAVLFFDIDHFKQINDSYGHSFGDLVLKEVAKRIRGAIREVDTLARFGGDEFAVIFEDLEYEQDVSFMARKILDALKKPMKIEGVELYVSGSIGISLYPNDTKEKEDLLRYADTAMFKAKNDGRDNFQFYSPEMTEIAFERLLLETNLRNGISKGEFEVYFQPQVDAKNELITGAEALVRWNHPVMGVVSPAKFIPLAESTGLIVEIDRIVMRQALQRFRSLREAGLQPGRISINLSVKNLESPDFFEEFEAMIAECGCRYESVEFEVVESQVMNRPEESVAILEKLASLGVKISVDDFGTGYSSLAYLKNLPLTKLKIDQSFVAGINKEPKDMAIIKSIIAMAHNLGLEVIAEGVEDEEQKIFLIENGCNNIQGYLYAQPLKYEDFKAMLENKMVYFYKLNQG